jgi:hypothetical protein
MHMHLQIWSPADEITQETAAQPIWVIEAEPY